MRERLERGDGSRLGVRAGGVADEPPLAAAAACCPARDPRLALLVRFFVRDEARGPRLGDEESGGILLDAGRLRPELFLLEELEGYLAREVFAAELFVDLDERESGLAVLADPGFVLEQPRTLLRPDEIACEQ